MNCRAHVWRARSISTLDGWCYCENCGEWRRWPWGRPTTDRLTGAES